jgi:hypothetical protein
MRKTIHFTAILTALLASSHAAFAQQAKVADVKTIASVGRMNGHTYRNDYFHVNVQIPTLSTYIHANTIIGDNRAQLVEAGRPDGAMQLRHTFVLAIHAKTEADPEYTTRFVRSVRHMYEREGFETLTAESVIAYSGRTFVYSVLRRKAEGQNVEYYKGICFTELNGYMFGYWGEAFTQDQLNKLMDLKSRLTFQ